MASELRSTLACAAILIAGAPSMAAPVVETGELQHNGTLSRHVWSPDLVRTELGGLRVSAGVALGLHGAVQSQMQRRVVTSLSLDVGTDARVSLLPGGRRGAMLVLHSTR